MRIRILIADDHPMISSGIQVALEADLSLQLVATAKDGAEAVQICLKEEIDIVLMDLTMPVMNGFDATRVIAESIPRTKVIALSMHDDAGNLQRILNAGAKGYLLKSVANEELRSTIKRVHAGETVISPSMKEALSVEPLYPPDDLKEANLTERELEVVKLLSIGKTNANIAASLNISERTVETHRKNLMKKIGVENVSGLMRWAFMRGII